MVNRDFPWPVSEHQSASLLPSSGTPQPVSVSDTRSSAEIHLDFTLPPQKALCPSTEKGKGGKNQTTTACTTQMCHSAGPAAALLPAQGSWRQGIQPWQASSMWFDPLPTRSQATRFHSFNRDHKLAVPNLPPRSEIINLL